jgi:GxxExxY protein
MNTQPVVTPYDDLTYRVTGCAMESHSKLGPGHREDIYQRDLELRLQEAGIAFEPQHKYEVYDSKHTEVVIGYYIPDFVVMDEKGNVVVVVEIKALRGLDNSHFAQIIGYLAVSGCSIGLLLNFGARSLQHKRVFPPKTISEHRVNREWLYVPEWLSKGIE